jgi:hypothetical protein
VKISPMVRVAAAVPVVMLALLFAGCGGSYGGGGGGNGCGIYGGMCPTPTPPPVMTDCSAAAPLVAGNYQVGLNLALNACNDTTYGMVRAYTVGSASNLIKAPAGSNIVFINNDTTNAHTADFLASSLPFPGSYGSGAQRATSAAGTLINNPSFSTGTLAHSGGTSAVYKVPAAPGTITLIGCYFHYDGFGMRSVVIAQ